MPIPPLPWPDPVSIGKTLGSGLVSLASKTFGAFSGTLRISLIGPDHVSYYRTPDDPPNREIFNNLPLLSYTLFRIKLQLYSSYKMRLHRIETYVFHPDLKMRWDLLSGVDFPTQHSYIRQSLRSFAEVNSHPVVPESEKVDNNGRNCELDIEPDGAQEILIARVGSFLWTLPEERNQEKSFAKILMLLYANTSLVCLLCVLPKHMASDKGARPVILKAVKKAGTDTEDAIAWADRNLSTQLLKGRPSTRFFVKLH